MLAALVLGQCVLWASAAWLLYSTGLCPVCYCGDPVALFFIFLFPLFLLFFFFLLYERNLCVLQQVNCWLFSCSYLIIMLPGDGGFNQDILKGRLG